MDDMRVSTILRKFGDDFGHDFENGSRCKFCNIDHNEFQRNKPHNGMTSKLATCQENPESKFEYKHKTTKPQIQKISKDDFWSFLYHYYKERGHIYSSFKDTFEYFWKNHKINRSTFIKLFNEIYSEQRFDGKNALRCYGSPSGTYANKDGLPMQLSENQSRMWFLWGIDDFDRDDTNYQIDKQRKRCITEETKCDAQ